MIRLPKFGFVYRIQYTTSIIRGLSLPKYITRTERWDRKSTSNQLKDCALNSLNENITVKNWTWDWEIDPKINNAFLSLIYQTWSLLDHNVVQSEFKNLIILTRFEIGDTLFRRYFFVAHIIEVLQSTLLSLAPSSH